MPRREVFTEKSSDGWLSAKREKDGAEGLWRVENALYDLSVFVKKHPGGADWLTATKGTDITEAFECHHPLSTSVSRTLLKRYFVREATEPRNSPFTFQAKGFFNTLRQKLQPLIKEAKKTPGIAMRRVFDGTLAIWLVLVVVASLTSNFFVAALAGIALGMNAISAHNFFHQADNWRLYAFDLTGLSSYEWRISHGLSHHLFPNTIWDLEVSALEPLFCFLPSGKKNLLQRYGVIIYSHVLYTIVLPLELLKRVIGLLTGKRKPRKENLLNLVPFAFFLFFTLSFGIAIKLWFVMLLSTSYWFAFMGLIAAHHSPDGIWHDGDPYPVKDMDWGAFQLHAVRDREYVNGKNGSLLLVGTMFGDHLLHHLFPTVDHSHLHKFYPALEETVAEFGFSYDFTSILSLAIGKYRQLARNHPKKND